MIWIQKIRHLSVPGRIFCLFDLILYIFQLYQEGSSCVEPVLRKDLCVLLKEHSKTG